MSMAQGTLALCSVPSADSPHPPTRIVVFSEKIEPVREIWWKSWGLHTDIQLL